MNGKAIILSAPSGAGKTTLVKHLLDTHPGISFSVSACSRKKRAGETDGKDYYFLSKNDFLEKIKSNEFVEWEEVYKDQYYGTLKSEIERIWAAGKQVIFDVDVVGGLTLKQYFGSNALAIFVMPPSIEVLTERLKLRGTETPESLNRRIKKAEKEISYAPQFDRIIVNNNLEVSKAEVVRLVDAFIGRPAR